MDISTFSKANKNRSAEVFEKILNKGLKKLKKQKGKSKSQIKFPKDSTIITLTSKLLWVDVPPAEREEKKLGRFDSKFSGLLRFR